MTLLLNYIVIYIMIFDMHTHTILSSCSVLDFNEIIDIARIIGLDGICITDHRTMDIRHHITEGIQPNGVIVIFGMEYDTPHGDFLIFGSYEHIPQNMAALDLLNYIKHTKGIAIAAHPFRKNRPVKESFVRDKLCTVVESINGRNSEIENLKTETWQKRYRQTQTGGSDAHTPHELGKVVTRFSMPIYSRKDLVYALRHGLCKPEMSTSPVFVKQVVA